MVSLFTVSQGIVAGRQLKGTDVSWTIVACFHINFNELLPVGGKLWGETCLNLIP